MALCSVHAAKADNGYYPDEYFRTLKQEGLGRAEAVRGEFDYLRHEILAVVGSGMYIRTDTILEINGERCIYFNRDEHGYLLLNFKMPAVAGEPRAWMEDNVWIVPPAAKNVECPPRGRFLAVKFENGDSFRVEFSDVQSIAALGRRYPDADCDFLEGILDFPVTVAEFWERSQSGAIEFGRTAVRLPGPIMIHRFVTVDCAVGISVELPKSQLFGGRPGRQ